MTTTHQAAAPALSAALLAQQIFDTAAATRHGVGPHLLRAAVRSGAITRVHRGWYAVASSDPDERYRRRCRALARATGRAPAGPSALAVKGVALYDVDDRPVYLAGRPDERRRRSDVVVVAPVEAPADGRSTGSPVIDALLLTAVIDPELAVAAADSACRLALVHEQQVRDAALRIGRRRGGLAARQALQLTDVRRESVGESRLAWRCHGWGIALVPQVWVPTDIGRFRVDFEVEVEGGAVVVEFDGEGKYATRADLIAEKRREDAIRRTGRGFVRVGWSDLYQPATLHARLLAQIARRRAGLTAPALRAAG